MSKVVKEKNGKLPKWAILVIIGASLFTIIVFGLIIALAIIDERNADVDRNLVVSDDVTTSVDEERGIYLITGYITNEGKVPYYDIDISYYLYDRNNNIIGEAEDIVSKLEVGKTWKFTAEYYGMDYEDVVRVELDEVDGDDYEPW